jgi:hypothetical protein
MKLSLLKAYFTEKFAGHSDENGLSFQSGGRTSGAIRLSHVQPIVFIISKKGVNTYACRDDFAAYVGHEKRAYLTRLRAAATVWE